MTDNKALLIGLYFRLLAALKEEHAYRTRHMSGEKAGECEVCALIAGVANAL